MTIKSMPALEWVQSIPSDRWVSVRSSKGGVLDLVREFNARSGWQPIRVSFSDDDRAGWIKVKKTQRWIAVEGP